MMEHSELPEEELQLFTQFAIHQHSDAVYWVLQDGSLAYVNDAACKMLEYTRDDLLKMRIVDLNLEVPQKAWSTVWKQLEQMGRRTFETIHVTNGGRPIPVEVTATLFTVGNTTYSCAFTRDLTDRKHLEARLRQAEKMEAIGRLAGGIAHDFNNQLAGMLGGAELLQAHHCSDAKSAQLLNCIFSGINRSTDLTAQLLAFSRQGRSTAKPVDVHCLITEIGKILKHSIDKRIVQTQALRATKTVVVGDSTQLQSALLNLALNARDAMPQGGTLHISTCNEWLGQEFCQRQVPPLTPGEFLRVTLENSGEGMDPHTQSRMFEPFLTTKNIGTDQGTELGLAAVHSTMKSHHGAMAVRSNLGTGTSIALLVPLSQAENPLPRSAKRAADATPGKLNGVRVLLVEDERYLRDACRLLLEALGCTVSCAANGRAAIDYFSENHQQLDIVLLDLEMPILGGEDTLAQLKKLDPNIVVVIVSGRGPDSLDPRWVDTDCHGFLQKPFSHNQLADALSMALGRS